MAVTFTMELPSAEGLTEGTGAVPGFTRADLTFYGLDHSGVSYEARVFLDTPDADADTPLAGLGYAGSFFVFGHGGCFGEEGHCAVRGPVTAFDRRLPHQLVPATRVLICTEAIQALIAAGHPSVQVTVVPVVRPGPLAGEEPPELRLDQVALHTYE
jgi:hypothetical protein